VAANRPRFRPALRPGASSAESAALEHDLGTRLPPELRAWLAWHNGQNADLVGGFVERFFLLGTAEIDNTFQRLNAHPPVGWSRAWIPFLADDDDNFVCLDTALAGPPVREVWPQAGFNNVVAPSLTAWARTFLDALERGDYHEDPERGSFERRREKG
jgi:cell wall assembly regulator SMI1